MGSASPRPASAPPPLLLALLLLLQAERPPGAELTFELPDSAQQCFHQDVEQGARFSLDYQVGPPRPVPPAWGVGVGVRGGTRGCPSRWDLRAIQRAPSKAVGSGCFPPCEVVVGERRGVRRGLERVSVQPAPRSVHRALELWRRTRTNSPAPALLALERPQGSWSLSRSFP